MNILKKWFAPATKTLANRKSLDVYDTIKVIHDSFDIASEQALKEANEILQNSSKNVLDEDKALLMRRLGFRNTKLVGEVVEKENIDREARQKAATVAYYQMNYPQYKFIFTNQVEEICKKYGLVCGEISQYKGDVPMKNLKEIESFSIKTKDIALSREYRARHSSWVGVKSMLAFGDISNHEEVEMPELHSPFWQIIGRVLTPHSKYYTSERYYTIEPFSICAPESDMDMRGYQKEGVFLKREIPDPIVLYPQPHNNGYLIVSKWGLEGQDAMLTNELSN